MTASESHFYLIPRTGAPTRLENMQEALQAQEAKLNYVWLDFFQPGKDELQALIEPLDLHPLSIEDCLDENQMPKMDDYPGNTFIIFNNFNYADHMLTIDELNIFISDHFLVTVRHDNAGSQSFIQEIERSFVRNNESVRLGPAFLLHFILDQVVDRKFLAIEGLEDELNIAEEAIMADLPRFNPAELLHLRRDLLAVRKSLFNERETLVKICRLDCPFITKKAIFFYRDIYDHLSKFFELTESSRDLVTSLMEMYLSMLNNQMAKAANDTNATVRRLTFITTIFMPLSLLAGIGGMSEWSMMTGPENWKFSYPLFLLVMLVMGLFNYYLLKAWEKKRGIKD
ncbi:MAG: Mg2+/Co2+ transporter [Chloroflexi bacterium GWB2_49_20]|nr:MAG: Mg2+/Co2+ transporter [Chloroflexi bacterium GWB2_49_20]OGN79238.1 MAG: Mg2+/Co2+ transporter [Chloroflexi bacterium GWC2_49_37]OGN82992.1 MAG: Mg2+/Co2+ transporter [Chloroflexi bacterium GWD2_49_16]HCC78650.1 Mg2+/Co2+ transporter [Anaerolineae bacterium]